MASDNGRQYRVVFTNSVAATASAAVALTVRRIVAGDLDSDQIADLALWRPDTGTWYWLTSRTGYDYARYGARQWGAQSQRDVPLAGDIDGDGTADLVIWRAATGTWYWLTSSSGYNYAFARSKQWGTLRDLPMTK